jgi:hypothetical protein
LVPLSVAELFTDPGHPVRRRQRRGLAGTRADPSRRALLDRHGHGPVTVASFYAAFLLAVLASRGILWRHHAIDVAIAGVAAAFAPSRWPARRRRCGSGIAAIVPGNAKVEWH